MYPLIMYAFMIICILASPCAAFQFVSKMYISLDKTSPCVLRMNGTHTFGCTSSREGDIGVVHVVRNVTDLQWVLNASPMDSYIVVVNNEMFTRQNLLLMDSSSKVSGIIFAQDRKRPDIKPTSPEDTCPNRYSGLAARENVCEKPWNVIGSGLLQEKWNIPIFFINDNDTIVQLHHCFDLNAPYDESQTSRSLCALQLSSHMYGAVDSRTCLRRNAGLFNLNPVRYCGEMGNENIYLPIVPLDKFKQPRKSYIIVAARMDSTSFFYLHHPASLTVATSLTTLILTAKLLFDLTKGQDTSKYDQNVLFVLFSGEAYDYIGSSRVVYDLQNNQYPSAEQPISMDNIDLYIELSQLHNSSEVFHHSVGNVSSFINKFQNRLEKTNLTASTRRTVPPSSMQSFLLAKKDFPGVLLSSYNENFTNKYYHSLFDDDYHINYKYAGLNGTVPQDSIQSFVAQFATALATTLYEQISKSAPNVPIKITKEEADELLHCYLDTLQCELVVETGIGNIFNQFVMPTLQDTLLDYYVGVYQYVSSIVLATKLFLIFYSKDNTTSTTFDECTGDDKLWVPNKNVCWKSLVNSTPALSPAFLISDYDMASGQYATWTESSWSFTGVRMFMQPSRRYEWIVCVTGILIFCASFAFTYSVKKNAKQLFDCPNLITTATDRDTEPEIEC